MTAATQTLLAISLVIGAWWGATGAILFLARRPARTYRTTFLAASAVLPAALVLLRLASYEATIAAAALAFMAALLLWGWLEISFLLGGLTGPRRCACPAGCRGVARFRYAVGAILYHELVIVLLAAVVIGLTWRLPNRTGLWIFLLLWGMRISAKLNLFLGVPNTGEIMLPAHLKYLGSYFRRRRLNPLLPLSILMASAVSLALIAAAANASAGSFAAFEFTLLATLATLALLEHCMLVLPMPADAPWRLRRPRAKPLLAAARKIT
jgi:putative photosynthetic complex assembly protein 2